MAMLMQNFPLLNEIDEQSNSENLDWNKNAFQTLLTSNLPMTTIFYYAIDVGLQRLENSLYEVYWDVTAEALHDLSQFLLTIPSTDEIDSYVYEAKCQLLMYASIAIIKLNTIRHRSANVAKMSCATMFLLLLEQSKSYETPSVKNQYSSRILSMRSRYSKRIFLIGQWLPTLSKIQLNNIQMNYENYIETMIDDLFPAVSLREKINAFLENHLFKNEDLSDNQTTTDDFVIIRRFPKFNEKTIEHNSDLMHMGLVRTLDQLNYSHTRQLVCCIWMLSCMIEADRISLGVLNHRVTREYFSLAPIDFEQKPILIESLNERDIIVFLLLCAQQNTRLSEGDSTLHPYLLYYSPHLCTPNQKSWWQMAIEQTSWSEFVDHLATIRLDEKRINQYPPKIIILQTAKILFKTAQVGYEQHSNRSASSYEQYAIQYLQTAKTMMKNQLNDSMKSQRSKQEKLFFVYAQKSIGENNEGNRRLLEQLVAECEKLARQCDELKLLPEPEPPRTSSPAKENRDFHISSILSPVSPEKPSTSIDFSLFTTPPSKESRAADAQTVEETPTSPVIPIPFVKEVVETPSPSLPPIVDMLFSHMNGVNQWINRFCISNEGIQNDIDTIRDRLEKLNRATSQMIFSNVRLFQTNPSENNGQLPPSGS